MLLCKICEKEKPIIKRPKNGNAVCKNCFYACFEEEIHQTIIKGNLFKRGDRVAVASSGGKDSTVLGYTLKLLNERYDYGLDLILLSIDEGITGYRDDSLESVKRNQQDYQLPLTILNYKDIYGWTMDDIVKQIGLKNNCTFCGVFRRQALDRGAMQLKCDSIVTGHNADDLAETILMNVLRGDIARLKRSVYIVTENKKDNQIDKNIQKKEFQIKDNQVNELQNSVEECCNGELINNTEVGNQCCDQNNDCCTDNQSCFKQLIFKSPIGLIPRSKPFKYTYEKEIVMYAHFKKLDYFSTECIYSPNSYRGHARAFLKELEVIRPSVILDIIHSGEMFLVKDTLSLPMKGVCVRCGYISSQNICKACVMLEGLNKGQPKLGVGKSKKVELIKQVNNINNSNIIKVCRKDNCECNAEHRKSRKQMKKQARFKNNDKSILDLKIKQDVNKLMNELNLEKNDD